VRGRSRCLDRAPSPARRFDSASRALSGRCWTGQVLAVLLYLTAVRGCRRTARWESDQSVRMLGTASNWPPSYLDEIANLLTNVPYPHLRPFQRRDSYYRLVVALAELRDSLDLGPTDQKGEGDRRSLVSSVPECANRGFRSEKEPQAQPRRVGQVRSSPPRRVQYGECEQHSGHLIN
jgi:hypothetical protein